MGELAQASASMDRPRRLIYVADASVPETGTRFLRESCAARAVEFLPLDPHAFDFAPERQLNAGDMLYRPAISYIAQRVEQFLFAPGVATFYARNHDVFFSCTNSTLLFQREGLSVPRTIPCHTSVRATLDDYVRRLGGYPVVFKLPGFSTGIGVGRLDSAASLYSFVDLALALGRLPHLMAYIPDSIHWRLIVVGQRVVASYRNVVAPGDFRTLATRDVADYEAPPSGAAEELAVRSTTLLRHELGGVDVLEHPSGRVYLLENNFPCYFAQAQDVAGVDIAGAMIEHLLMKATGAGRV